MFWWPLLQILQRMIGHTAEHKPASDEQYKNALAEFGTEQWNQKTGEICQRHAITQVGFYAYKYAQKKLRI